MVYKHRVVQICGGLVSLKPGNGSLLAVMMGRRARELREQMEETLISWVEDRLESDGIECVKANIALIRRRAGQ